MNTNKKIEVPLVNIERNPLILLFFVGVSALFVYLTYYTIFNKEAYEVKPMGFFLFVPTLVISFQTLWMLLNPYAIIFDDKLEIKRSMFSNSEWHFVDIKLVSELGKGGLKIVYNDDEVERIGLFGIRDSHRALLREELNKHVQISIQKRALAV